MQTFIQHKNALLLRFLVGLTIFGVASASGSPNADGPALQGNPLLEPVPKVKSAWPVKNDEFSYTYVQASYGAVSSSSNEDAQRLAARLAVGLGDYVYFGGEYSQTEEDNSSNGTDYSSLSVGGHLGMTEEIDMYLELGYRTQTVDVGTASTDSDGPLAAIGFRGISSERMFEAEARYTRNWLSDDSGANRNFSNFRFELLWRATDNFALVAGGDWEKNSNASTLSSLSFGLRASL